MKRSDKKRQFRRSLSTSEASSSADSLKQTLVQAQHQAAPTRIKVLEEFAAPREYGGPKPPAWLDRIITKIGGTNPYGHPMYRLVWAPARLSPVGGTWNDWPTHATSKDKLLGTVKPLRRTVGVRLKPRYLSAGSVWALERWQPAYRYGSPERWYSPVHLGGTMVVIPWANMVVPSQGAYPHQGDYEYTNFGYTNQEMSEYSVITAIQQIERHISALPPIGVRVANSCAMAQMEEDMVSARVEAEARDIMDNLSPAFDGKAFSAGKKHRHSSAALLEKLGITSHHI